jgi:hypothetical protein
MSDDDLRGYFEEMSDEEVRESFRAGPGEFEPSAWRLIDEQMRLRGLETAEEEPEVAQDEPPVRAATAAPLSDLEKRVEEGGTIALALAAFAFVLGTGIALYMRNGVLVESRVIVLTTMYVTTGVLMRRRHNKVAAGAAALITTLLYLSNFLYLESAHLWMYLAFSTLMYIPPIYWLWSAFLAARALDEDHVERGTLA